MGISKGFVLLIVLFLAEKLYAQDKAVIDSLISMTQSSHSDSLKVDAYIKIARLHDASDSAKTVSYANQAIELAKRIGYKTGEIDAYYARAHVAMSMGHVDVAKKDFQLIIDLSKPIGYKTGEANGLNGLGATYDFQGDYTKALECFIQSLKIAESQNDLEAMSSRYNNIGLIYTSQEDFQNALEYLNKSLTIHQKLQDRQGIALVHGNIGEAYLSSNQSPMALEHLNKALDLYTELNDLNGIANMHTALAKVYQEQNQVRKSIYHFLYAKDIYDKIGGQYFITYTYLGLGVSYIKLGEYNTAKKYLEKSLNSANQLKHMVNIREGWKYLSIVEEKLGNFRAALDAQRKFKWAADSVLNTEQTKSLTRLEANYEFEKEKDSIAFVQQKEQLALEKEIERQKWFKFSAFLIALFIALIALVVYRFYLIKRDKNKELVYKNEIIRLKNEELNVKNHQISDLLETEKKMAKEALELKERELASVTMISHEKNNILQRIGHQIGSLSQKVDLDVIPDIKEIKRTIKSNINDESWSVFTYQFEKVHPEFLNGLKKKFPPITQNDLRLCAYLKVGMDNKEIAQMSNVTVSAVKKSVQRLKKKMDLGPEDDLRELLIRL